MCRIADVLIELQHHGNADYIRWSLRFSCNMPNVFELLKHQAKKMELDLGNWLNEVKDQRIRVYELNYFTTHQLLALREELGTFSASKDQIVQIKPTVMNLLHGISKNLTPKLIRKVLSDQSGLHQVPDISQDNQQKPEKVELVHAPLSSPEAVKKVLHQEKVKRKHQTQSNEANFPHPQMTVDDLTQEQKSHLYNLEGCGYHVSLVLLGFERCSATSNMLEDVLKWCADHQRDFDYPKSEGSESESESDFDSDSDSDSDSDGDDDVQPHLDERVDTEVDVDENALQKVVDTTEELELLEDERNITNNEEQFNRKEENVNELAIDLKSVKRTSALEAEENIETIEVIPLDENHPAVIKLISLGYDIELCLEAVEKFPRDTRLAQNYIMTKVDKEDTNSNAGSRPKLEQEAEVEM